MRIEDLFSNVVTVIWLWFSRYCIKPQQFITVINYMKSLWTHYTQHERNSGGFLWITLSGCLSVRLSVHIRVWTITFFMVWHSLITSGTRVYHHKTMCRVHSWSRYDLELWPQSQIYRVFDIFLCPFHNDFYLT